MKKFFTLVLLNILICTQAFCADPKAKRIEIDDSGGYFSGTNVESALQEVGSSLSGNSEAIDDRVDTLIQDGTGLSWTYDDTANTLTGNVSITQYTDALARASISETITGLDYSSSTGVLSQTSGYTIPTTTEQSNWNTAFGWGDHALEGYLTAETDPNISSGVAGYFAYYPSTGEAVDDQTVLYTNGTNVGIGTSNPSAALHILDTGNVKIDGSGGLASGVNFYGDTTTNFGTTGASSVTFWNNSNERMRIKSDGNVGIGNTNPLSLLIVGDSNTGKVMQISPGGAVGDSTYLSFVSDRAFFGYDGPSGNTVIQAATSKGIEFNVNDATFGSGTTMTLNSSGNLGIGTTTIPNKLTVSGTSSFSDNVGIGTTAGDQKLSLSDGQMIFQHTTSNLVESGRIRFTEHPGTSYQGAFLHYDGNTNYFNIGVHPTSDETTNQDINAISIQRTDGNVGIGTTTLPEKLTVSGNASISGSIAQLGGSTGATLSATSGVLTMGGIGGSNNENITLNFESSSNSVYFGSTTGLREFRLGSNQYLMHQDSTNQVWGSGYDAYMQYDVDETNDSLKLGLVVGSSASSGNFLIVERADIDTNFGVPVVSNPTLRIQSADATTTSDFIQFYHNQTNPIVQFGNGSLTFLDPNSNETFIQAYTGSAVNELTVVNSSTGTNPSIYASGTDSNIGISITPAGTGGVAIGGSMPSDASAGDFGYDTTQKAFKTGIAGGADAYVPGVLFTQTADKTISDGTATTMFGTGVGSLTLPANFWTVGKTLRISLRGYMSTDGSDPAWTTLVKFGSTTIFTDADTTLDDTATNYSYVNDFYITCRSVGVTGTLMTQQSNQSWSYTSATSTVTVDTTSSSALDVTFDWSDTTGDSITVTNAIVEVLN